MATEIFREKHHFRKTWAHFDSIRGAEIVVLRRFLAISRSPVGILSALGRSVAGVWTLFSAGLLNSWCCDGIGEINLTGAASWKAFATSWTKLAATARNPTKKGIFRRPALLCCSP